MYACVCVRALVLRYSSSCSTSQVVQVRKAYSDLFEAGRTMVFHQLQLLKATAIEHPCAFHGCT